jgi:hypothetical protein
VVVAICPTAQRTPHFSPHEAQIYAPSVTTLQQPHLPEAPVTNLRSITVLLVTNPTPAPIRRFSELQCAPCVAPAMKGSSSSSARRRRIRPQKMLTDVRAAIVRTARITRIY